MIRIKREWFERMLNGYGRFVRCGHNRCIVDPEWCKDNKDNFATCEAAVMAWLEKENAIEIEEETC